MVAARNFYSHPSYMNGGSYTIYSGSRRQQKGGGMLGSFKKLVVPFGRRAMTTMKKVVVPLGRQVLKGAKNLAKNKTAQKIAMEVAKQGTKMLGEVVSDAMNGENVGTSLKNRGKAAALEFIADESKEPKKVSKNLRQTKRPAPKSINATRAKKYRRLSRAKLNRKNLF